MSLLNYFRFNRNKNSAAIARERLQIIVAHERGKRKANKINLQQLQLKLIDVISDYLNINKDMVKVELEHDNDRSVLELNVTLPDSV